MHPDRAGSDPEATEKYQILNEIHGVLLNEEKRQLYDIEKYVYIVSDEELIKCKGNYIGSESEKNEIAMAYSMYHGDVKKVLRQIPFLRWADQERIEKIIDELIKSELIMKEEPTKKPKKKRTAKQANLDQIVGSVSEPKRTRRQQAISSQTQHNM